MRASIKSHDLDRARHIGFWTRRIQQYVVRVIVAAPERFKGFMSLEFTVKEETTPAEALEMAYACGKARHAAGSKELDFVFELSERITVPYGKDPRIRFLCAGFVAGYFNHPLPDLARILAGCAVRAQRLLKPVRAGRPRKAPTAQTAAARTPDTAPRFAVGRLDRTR